MLFMKKEPMTSAGYARLEEELKHLRSVERPAISRALSEAREMGDISENAEFHAAKERQSHIEGRIRIVEDSLARAQVIETGGSPPDTVRFGVTVVLSDDDTGEEVRYTLIGEDESDVTDPDDVAEPGITDAPASDADADAGDASEEAENS